MSKEKKKGTLVGTLKLHNDNKYDNYAPEKIGINSSGIILENYQNIEGICKMLIPKEIFVEAYNEFINPNKIANAECIKDDTNTCSCVTINTSPITVDTSVSPIESVPAENLIQSIKTNITCNFVKLSKDMEIVNGRNMVEMDKLLEFIYETIRNEMK